ncbi:MAG: carboxypeptidase regulatory-like domain-containing protein, partial [Bacteroidota bacterium]
MKSRPMNLKSPLLLFLLLSVCSSVLLAQRGRSTTTYSIVGKIFDGANDVPLQYATVALLQAQDSAVVGGTTTDEKGFFELEAKGGEYLIAATFLGFEKRFISAGKVDEMHPFVNLKTIRLEVKATTLDEVEIQAEKSRMEFALDKRVFNVGQDLANNGGNAADLLDNIPSVTVDIDGNVAVRGNSGVRILINGKPSGFANINPADALKQMSANMIEKVEIITNPSARYEAEGTAGVLNIVLK